MSILIFVLPYTLWLLHLLISLKHLTWPLHVKRVCLYINSYMSTSALRIYAYRPEFGRLRINASVCVRWSRPVNFLHSLEWKRARTCNRIETGGSQSIAKQIPKWVFQNKKKKHSWLIWKWPLKMTFTVSQPFFFSISILQQIPYAKLHEIPFSFTTILALSLHNYCRDFIYISRSYCNF